MTLHQDVARVVVAAAIYLPKEEREIFRPEIDRILRAFDKRESGTNMPLRSFAFAGDQAKAMERFLFQPEVAGSEMDDHTTR